MTQYSNTETGTTVPTSASFINNCENCPRVNTQSSSTAGGSPNAEILIGTIGHLHDLQKEVQELQEKSKKTVSFYDSGARLNRTVRVVVIVLMVIPFLQLISCAAVVYLLGIEDELPNLLNWVLGTVSVLSLVELIMGSIKLFLYEKRMDELEEKINSLSTTRNT